MGTTRSLSENRRRAILIVLLALLLALVVAGEASAACTLPEQANYCSPPDSAPFPTIQ